MSEQSKIQWCDSTWNPWIGCTKVSEGCKNCYAENSTPTRVARSKGVELWGGTNRQRASKATFEAPLKWNEKPWVCDECGNASGVRPGLSSKPDWCSCVAGHNATFHRRRVFALSLGDIWDKAVPIETLADALDIIRRCPDLDFLLLTKRPENWYRKIKDAHHWLIDHARIDRPITYRDGAAETATWLYYWHANAAIPANVWIGCTVENQEQADKRIPELLKIPARVRFLSVEPMLGPIEFSDVSNRSDAASRLGRNALEGIDWIICGGESGTCARVFNIEWARSVIAQCKAAGVAVFVKQMGSVVQDRNDAGYDGESPREWPMGTDFDDDYFDGGVYQGKPVRVKLRDPKGGNPEEWPSDLRVRETPVTTVSPQSSCQPG